MLNAIKNIYFKRIINFLYSNDINDMGFLINNIIFFFIINSHGILMNLFFIFNVYIRNQNHNILIEIDTSLINSIKDGPASFLKGLYKLLPYSSDKCCFISSSFINPIFKPDFYYITASKLTQEQFDNLIKTKISHQY